MLNFIVHALTAPASDKSDKSVPFLSVLYLEHRSHRLKGYFSLALVIEIPKIPEICGSIFLLNTKNTKRTKNFVYSVSSVFINLKIKSKGKCLTAKKIAKWHKIATA